MVNAWLNNDGLYIKYGNTEGTTIKGGEVNVLGSRKQAVFDIDLTTLTLLGTSQVILSDTFVIPAGTIIDEIKVEVIEASAGTNSNFDLGLIRTDRTTAYDADGLIAAGDDWHTSEIGTITTYVQGSTEHGALLGTILANSGLLTAAYDTGVFTDGVIRVTLWYFKPAVTA